MSELEKCAAAVQLPPKIFENFERDENHRWTPERKHHNTKLHKIIIANKRQTTIQTKLIPLIYITFLVYT